MTIRSRRTLFYALFLAFIALGAGATLYAQGWRLDLATFTPKKVGAIYVQSTPRDADIALDGKPVKSKSGFFEAGTLINSLFPKSHTLSLSREGYHPWKRTLSVEPARVAEAKHAVLVPEISTTIATSGVKTFWMTNAEYPIVALSSGTLTVKNKPLSGTTVRIVSNDGLYAITENEKYHALFLANLAGGTSTSLNPVFSKLQIASTDTLSFDTTDSTRILVRTPHSLAVVDIKRATLSSVTRTPKKTITAGIAGSSLIVWAMTNPAFTTSTVTIYDELRKTSTTISGDLPGTTQQLLWIRQDVLGALQTDGGLYLSRNGKSFEKLASDVRSFFPSPDGGKIASLERKSMEVFSLDSKDYWRFNVQGVEGIDSLSWHNDSNNLFLHFPYRVMLLDLDDSAQENITLVAETSRGVYDVDSRRFFFVNGDKLSVLEFPEK